MNSPGLIRSLDLVGHTVVQKTTAGTVGALAVASAPLVLCASFVLARATEVFLKTDGSGPVTFVVTGDDGQAAEDLACAEYIGRHLAGGDAEVAPHLHRARTSRAAPTLPTECDADTRVFIPTMSTCAWRWTGSPSQWLLARKIL